MSSSGESGNDQGRSESDLKTGEYCGVSSVGRGGAGGATAPPLACQPKCRIRKISCF